MYSIIASRRIAFLCCTLVATMSHSARAGETEDTGDSSDDSSPVVWQPRTRSVAVFKNGMGFFVRQGSVNLRDGWCAAGEVPPAKFGTLAIYAVDNHELVDVIGSGPGEIVEFDDVDAPRQLEAKRTRLEAAMNLSVQLTYKHRGEVRTAAGKLVSIGTDFVVLDSAGNSAAVPVPAIKKMQVLELPLRIHVADENGGKDAAGPTDIGMAYLREGLTWIPEYSLDVLDDQTAEITLRGTLVNEAEDLIHCDVNFVVGVPHFTHTEYMAPIAVGQVIRTLGAAVAPRGMQGQIAGRAAIANNARVADQFDKFGATSSVAERAVEGETKLTEGFAGLPRLDFAGGGDFTVYSKPDLTVRRGERAIVTLMVKRIKYADLYRWSPPAGIEHYLVLDNDTDAAWTAGPCLTKSGRQPLSEDLLPYTPRGGRCEVPVAASVNIATGKKEMETARQLDARTLPNKSTYDLVTLDGELRLQNFEKKEVDVIVVRAVPGRPLTASDGGERSIDAAQLKLIDRVGSLRWAVKLPAGESKTLTYQYERFVPSN